MIVTNKKKESAGKKVAPKKQEHKAVAVSPKKELKHQEAKPEKKAPAAMVAVKTNKQVKKQSVQAVAQKNPHQPMSTGTGKKRLMVSYEKLPDEVIDVIRTKYPYGYNHDLKEVKGIDNKKFFVLPIELPEVVYLVKVDLRKPIKIQDDSDEEEDIFTPEEGFSGEEEFPAEDLEQMEGDGDDEGGEEESKKKKRKNDDGDDDE